MGEILHTLLIHLIDDFYFSALSNEEELLLNYDDKYAKGISVPRNAHVFASGSRSTPLLKR